MPRSPIAGRAQTVLGTIAAEDMGITLPHEHLLIDFTVMFKEPDTERERELARQPVELANLGWVRRNFSSSLDNLRLVDENVARDELLLYRAAGGRTLVDPTNCGLSRDPSRWRVWPGRPGSTSSWARDTTWPPRTRRTWTPRASKTWRARS
jgi:phosphotriesterase-related protein